MKAPMRATKKPVTIEFIEWTGNNLFEVITFTDGKPNLKHPKGADSWDDYLNLVKSKGFKIKTLEGYMDASIGDLIIKGIKGEFYPCKPDIFALTYDVDMTPDKGTTLRAH